MAAAILLAASALGFRLGPPPAAASALAAFIVLLSRRQAPCELLRNISWSVLPLVAGLFVLVEGLARTGVIERLSRALRAAAEHTPATTSWAAGAITAVACNLMKNLPMPVLARGPAPGGSRHRRMAVSPPRYDRHRPGSAPGIGGLVAGDFK